MSEKMFAINCFSIKGQGQLWVSSVQSQHAALWTVVNMFTVSRGQKSEVDQLDCELFVFVLLLVHHSDD